MRSAPQARSPARVLVIACDPGLIEASRLAVAALGGHPPLVLSTEREVLRAVVTSVSGFSHLILEDGELPIEQSLVDAMAEASPAAVISLLTPEAALSEDGAFLRGLLGGTRHLAHDANRASRNSNRLQAGLQGNSLLLRYQPIIHVRTRRLVLVEALARWRSEPVALTPVNFIPAMEQMGLSRPLAAAVTRIAARDMSRLPARLGIPVSVNLPAPELDKRDVVAWLGHQLSRTRFPRRRLMIELTETAPVRDLSRMARTLRRLKAAGHGVLMDDYLLDDPRQRLLRLDFAGIKLDRSLVQSLPKSARARNQVHRMAKRGLTMTAEGVSTPALLRTLRFLGVARAQGFLMGRPLPVVALPAWNQRWRSAEGLAPPRKPQAPKPQAPKAST
ncbi:EAL domain-containing protein [Roseococcus sp. SDR]|uniref:EAL domain-containing protein n=1 Tax=Roseococcus sp. SDR TaxID=2835532 RepID=UPI001BCFBDDD|nr:EAL domain-containing protein [Roseococcus sp. SDR]MBS7790983.1 EAL domain-containing protein [Roseococcus sp. SDR]MBV1846297.1 EAL domain-containing protein [Roseococcus sp. SDR]